MSYEKKNGATQVDYQFPQPKAKVSFGKMLYNSKEGTICGRTIGSWSRLGLFYIIFYAVLAGLFAICMQGLFSTLSDSEPKWKLNKSLIGTNPGLGFRPLPEETERGSVIEYDTKKPTEGQYWKNLLDEFLEPYIDNTQLPNGGLNQKFCEFNTTIGRNQVCAVNIDGFGPCSPKNEYGYNKGSPCVFVKLNKIFDWYPEFYDDINDLPEEMPKDLVDHITQTHPEQRKQIWISCQGEHSVDKENLGPIQYFPIRGFPAYYYPYQNQLGYLSPLVAIHFEKPPINQLLNVECRAWAKNIIYNGGTRDRKGSVTFQLFID